MGIYQQRMDKCTTEQFWMVALLGAMNGFIISHKEALTPALGTSELVAAVAMATLVGMVFVLSRHVVYRHYDQVLSPHLVEASNRMLHSKLLPAGRIAVRCLGVAIYLFVILASGTATLLVLRM
jgi:hypothetical protein